MVEDTKSKKMMMRVGLSPQLLLSLEEYNEFMKLSLSIFILTFMMTSLSAQSKTIFVHRDPDDRRETIRFLWNKGQVYTYTKTSTTLKIEGSDTLTNTSEIDTISFMILKSGKKSVDIRVILYRDKIRKYFINKQCKIDPAFDQFNMMYIDMKYIYKGQQFVVSNCDDVKAQCKKIIAYNKDCVFEDSFDERIHKSLMENVENCSTLANWFSFDLQFLFTYDGYPYPKQDTIRYTIENKPEETKPKDPDISEDEQKMIDKLNQVHYVCFKNVNQTGVKTYTIREDTSIEPGISTKTQNLMLEGSKKMILEDIYKKRKERIQSNEEDNFEEIILSAKNELMGINKVMKSTEYVDKVRKSEYYLSAFKRLE
jgi:hypothetical protein